MQQILPSTFNRRITAKRSNAVTDDAGGTSTGSYTELFSTWADIQNMSSEKKIYLGVDAFKSAYKITLRYFPAYPLKANDLIDYNDGGTIRTLQIDQPQLIMQGYKKFWILNGIDYTIDA